MCVSLWIHADVFIVSKMRTSGLIDIFCRGYRKGITDGYLLRLLCC